MLVVSRDAYYDVLFMLYVKPGGHNSPPNGGVLISGGI